MSNKRTSGVPKPGKPGKPYQPRSNSSVVAYVLGGVALLVVAVVVIGGIVWNSHRGKQDVDDSVLSENAAMIIGNADAPHTIDIFEDFQCPVCKQFEAQSGESITKAIESGQLRARYHMLNFLNSQSSSGDYSSRAAGALQCVAEGENRDVFLKFHTALYEQQPAEGGSSDHSNADLARIAGENGASDATQKCVSDGAKVDQANTNAEQSQTQLSKATGGQVGTPTVLSGGEVVPNILNGPQWLETLLAG